jgi:hypothetical protein
MFNFYRRNPENTLTVQKAGVSNSPVLNIQMALSPPHF